MTPEFLAILLWLGGGLAFVIGFKLGRHTGKHRATRLDAREKILQRYADNIGLHLSRRHASGSKADIEQRLREVLDQFLPVAGTYDLKISRGLPGEVVVDVEILEPKRSWWDWRKP